MDYWAKTPVHSGEPGLSLFQHTEQVLEQMGQLIKIYQHEINEIKSMDLPRVLLYAALLHDFGKVHIDFQEQLKGNLHFGLRHEILSLAFLKYLEVPETEYGYLAAAIALHHKEWRKLVDGTIKSPSYYVSHFTFDKIYPIFELSKGLTPTITSKLVEVLQNSKEIINLYSGINIQPYTVSDNGLSFEENIFKGLGGIDRVISSFESGGGRGRPVILNKDVIFQGILVRGLTIIADHIASAGPSINDKGFGSIEELLLSLGLTEEQLWYHQNTILEAKGNQVLVAPTGFGKTESALLWAAKQRAETGSRGRVYFLLPVRSSMNAMSDRFKKYFGELSTALVHGKSLCKAYEDLIETNYEKDKAVAEARIRESLSRLNSKPYRICSPYQLIRSFFGGKGSEANLCSALGAQLVFDEIHAYDTEVTGMALATAQYLCNMMKARVLFMSATIPSHLLLLIKGLFPELQNPIKVSSEDLKKITRHKIELVDNHIFSSDVINSIKADAASNSVLIVVNQVSRAIRLYDMLIEKGIKEVTLLHSRFNSRDRLQKERLLKPEKGKVLIATQVVEVSLDIDYDVGYFELAPLEALLQRFGRVNRKGQKRFSRIIVLENFETNNQKEFLPYECEHLIQVKSVLHQYLGDYPDGHIREDLIQEILDKSYPNSLKDRLVRDLNTKIEEFNSAFIKEYRPFGITDQTNVKMLQEKWDELFDGYEVLPVNLVKEAEKMTTHFDVLQLLVPIYGNLFFRLKKEGKIIWNEKLEQFIIMCNYNNDKGLEI